MRSFKTCTGIIFAALFITACGGKDKKAGDKPREQKNETHGSGTRLDGAWEIKRAEGGMADMNIGTIYEFKGNKLYFAKGSFTNPGTTDITDSTFSFQADGNEQKFMYNYRFNGDTLVVEMQNSGGQIFHMTRK